MIRGYKVNDTKTKFDKNYKFTSKGIYLVQYNIYGNINLNYMFKNIFSLISFEIISSCDKKLIIDSMEGTFFNCQNLKDVNFKNIDTKSIKSISKLFYNNKNLKNLDINELNTENIIVMSYLFYNCESIK